MDNRITGLSYFGNEKDSVMVDNRFEEERIFSFEDCLKSHVKYFDELIVFDDSTDGTTEIIKKYASQIIPIGKRIFDTGALRNELLSMVKTTWAWFFFADELSYAGSKTPKDVSEFISNHSQFDILSLRRWNVMGNGKPQGYQYPDYQGNIVKSTVKYTYGFHEIPIGNDFVIAENVFPLMIVHLFRLSDGKNRPDNRWRTFGKWHHNRRYIPEEVRDVSINAQTNIT